MVFGKSEIQKLATIIPHCRSFDLDAVPPSFECAVLTLKPLYKLSAVQEALLTAIERKNRMTGFEFQAWLNERETEGQKTVEVEEYFVDWQRTHYIKERNEAIRRKDDAHWARLRQIYEYCEVCSRFVPLTVENRSSNLSQHSPLFTDFPTRIERLGQKDSTSQSRSLLQQDLLQKRYSPSFQVQRVEKPRYHCQKQSPRHSHIGSKTIQQR